MKNTILWKIAILAGVILSLMLSLFFCINYSVSLEKQIYQRDSLIRALSFSDKLVRDYFDIKEDTLNKTRSYTLKDDMKTKIIERHEYIFDGRKIGPEELIAEYQKLAINYNQLIDEHKKLAVDYNQLIVEHNKLVENYNSLLKKKK